MFWRNIISAMLKAIIVIESILGVIIAFKVASAMAEDNALLAFGAFILIMLISAIVIILSNGLIGLLIEVAEDIGVNVEQNDKIIKLLETSVACMQMSNGINNRKPNQPSSPVPLQKQNSPVYQQPMPKRENTQVAEWRCYECNHLNKGSASYCNTCGSSRM